MLRKTVFYLFGLFFFISCKESKNEIIQNNIFCVDFDSDTSDKAPFTIRINEVLPLSDFLIADPKKMISTDDYFIFLDGYNENGKIILFDKLGSFIRQIDPKGEGPDQSTIISDIEYDEDNDVIIVLDNARQGIAKYSMTGDWLSFHKLAEYADEMVFDDGRLIFSKANNFASLVDPYNLIELDQNFNPINKYDRFEGDVSIWNGIGFGMSGYLNRSNKILYNSSFSDTIYVLTKGEMTPILCADFGANKLKIKDFHDFDNFMEHHMEKTFFTEQAISFKNRIAGFYFKNFTLEYFEVDTQSQKYTTTENSNSIRWVDILKRSKFIGVDSERAYFYLDQEYYNDQEVSSLLLTYQDLPQFWQNKNDEGGVILYFSTLLEP